MKNVITFYLFMILWMLNLAAHGQPSRVWASYYGQFTGYNDAGADIQRELQGTIIRVSAYDAQSGFLYVAGSTTDSAGIATPGSFKGSFHSWYQPTGDNNLYPRAAFIAKLDTLGNLVWATYFGGGGDIRWPSMTLDNSGNIYLTGTTNCDTGMATPGSHQPLFPHPSPNAFRFFPFLVKFNSDGERLWGTYYGAYTQAAHSQFFPMHIACDKQDNSVYMVGGTHDSTGMTTTGSYKEHVTLAYDAVSDTMVPTFDGFIAKFDSNGIRQWGTYYGGVGTDYFQDAWVDAAGNLYALGALQNIQSDTGIASPGVAEEVLPDGYYYNAFLVKFNSQGQRLWGTYVGNGLTPFSMAGSDHGEAAVYLSGYSGDYPGNTTPGAYQPNYGGGGGDLFLAKYDSSGTRQWSTFYGGEGDEPILLTPIPYYYALFNSLAIDATGNLLMVSITNSSEGIEKGCNPYPALWRTSLVSKWQPSGNLLWSSYYDAPLFSVTAGAGADFYLTGTTTYDSLATPDALQATKVAHKPSGLIARFSGDKSCPEREFTVMADNNQLTVDSGYAGYQWYDDGLPLAGADSFLYTPATDTGLFYVVITDSCGCAYTSDTLALPATGIGTMKGALNVSLYPNPNSGIFTLSGFLNTTAAPKMYYTITDISGRVLHQASISTQGNNFSQELDVRYLESGIYFLQLQYGQAYAVFKFAKSR